MTSRTTSTTSAAPGLDQITILDSIAWCHDLLPALKISRRVKTVAVHPTCSTNHLGLTSMLEAIAGQLGENVLVPIGTTCCRHRRRPRLAAPRAGRLRYSR